MIELVKSPPRFFIQREDSEVGNDMKKEVGRHGYGLDVGLKCVFLQFLYDLSDRELERELRFNIAYKWFCGFSAFEQTPDHSYFGRFRKSIGTHRMGKIFKAIVNKAKEKQLIRGVFHFTDATSITIHPRA